MDVDPRMGSLSWLQPSSKHSQVVPQNISVSRDCKPFGFGTPLFGYWRRPKAKLAKIIKLRL